MVGHSLGGLIARAGFSALENTPITQHLDIRAVLAVATPHQGARATHVSLGPVSGYKNVEPVVDEFELRTTEPLGDIHGAIAVLTSLASPDALEQLENAPELIAGAVQGLEYYEDASVQNSVKDVIGLSGSLIQEINSGQLGEPVFKRSLIGAEKRFIPVRAANEAMGPGTGNEQATVDNFDDIRWFYRANANAWDAQQIAETISLQFNQAKQSRRKRDSWNRGRNALDHIDSYWGEMIDSYVIESVEVPQWVYICTNDDPGDPGQFPPPTGEGDCWEWQYIAVNMPIATKNDVIVGPHYAVWNPGEDPNDRDINWYYDDVPADGGYNHFELRRYKRAYTLPGVFQQGDIAPPMGEAAGWLDETVFEEM